MHAIQLARPDEAGLVRKLSAGAYIPAYLPVIGAVPRPASEDYAVSVTAERVWLLERDCVPAAVLVLEPGPNHLIVYSVTVRPAHQGHGLARCLLAFAAEQAAALGLGELRLYTNLRMERNVALYRACGFHETGYRPHPSRPGEVLVDTARAMEAG